MFSETTISEGISQVLSPESDKAEFISAVMFQIKLIQNKEIQDRLKANAIPVDHQHARRVLC
jgi:hypothetical protein